MFIYTDTELLAEGVTNGIQIEGMLGILERDQKTKNPTRYIPLFKGN